MMAGQELESRRRCVELAIAHERIVHQRQVPAGNLALLRAWAAGDPAAEAEMQRRADAAPPPRPTIVSVGDDG